MGVSSLKGAALILVLALALALAVNRFSPAGIPLKGQWDPGSGVVMADPEKFGQTRALEIENPLKLRRMIQSGQVTVIDARQKTAYDRGHLPGALSFPLHAFDEHRTALGRVLARKTPVVVYCSGVSCQDSHKFARHLMAMGAENVMVYAGGFQEWSELGFEVQKNEG